MKASEIIAQLSLFLPQVTPEFTTNLTFSSLTQVAGVATAVTVGEHGLKVNKIANISGVQSPISISSFTRIGGVGTIVTSSDHDFTLGVSPAALTQGSVEPEFNGSFTISGIPNRRTILVNMDDSGPVTATGPSQLNNGSNIFSNYNGLKQVISVIDDNTFTFSVPSSSGSPAIVDNALLRTNPRISGVINLERLVSAYTKQDAPGDYWIFVSLGDVISSKDRNIQSDATSNFQRSNYYRQQIIQNCTIYLVVPCSGQIGAREARDVAEDMFRPICQSILFQAFDSGLYAGQQGTLNFISHGTVSYNTAIYIHSYVFEQVVDILFEDTVGYSPDVAFRDLFMEISLSHGTGEDPINNEIDLDEEPL